MAARSGQFDKPRHIKFWTRCSTLLPEDYTTGDGSRMSLGFFIVAALDLLGVLETSISSSERQSWIDWIYSCQVSTGGFRGFPGTNLGPDRNDGNLQWDPANLPNTYLALISLLILADDLSRLRRAECLQWLKSLQRENGSFGEFLGEHGQIQGKDDLRQCYCAAGISFILQSGTHDFEIPIFDESALLNYIGDCQGLDGGYGQSPLREPHSGMNFCAVAALSCLRQLQPLGRKAATDCCYEESTEDNIRWMLDRQTRWVEEDDSSDEEDLADDPRNGQQNAISDQNLQHEPNSHRKQQEVDIMGFNGRCGKIADTCYCFWNTGALAILNEHRLVDSKSLRRYLAEKVQHSIGGFSKGPGHRPDLMHSYLGLAALALYDEPGLKPLDATFAVSVDAMSRLQTACWHGILAANSTGINCQ